jgi:hypothetical protein
MKATLVVMPDGKAMLTFPQQLTSDEVERVQQLFAAWRSRPDAIAILENTDVVQVTDIELEEDR